MLFRYTITSSCRQANLVRLCRARGSQAVITANEAAYLIIGLELAE